MCTQVNSEYNLKKAQRKKDNSITKFWPLEVKYIQYLFLSWQACWTEVKELEE